MAKIEGPLMSIEAHGSVGPRLTFSSRKTGQQVRFQNRQVDAQSAGQLSQREKFLLVRSAWNDLSSADKKVYEDYTIANHLNMTGYNYFIQETFKTGYLYIFRDEFERATIGSDWNVSNLASATITNNKLVTEGPEDSWNDYTIAAIHELKNPLVGDFEIEADLEWIGRSDCLGGLFLYLVGHSGGYVLAGLENAWVAANGQFLAEINGIDSWDSGQDSRPFSGSMTIKITRESGVVKVYEDDNLRLTSTTDFNEDITHIRLTNTKPTTYNGNTAKWDYVTVKKLL